MKDLLKLVVCWVASVAALAGSGVVGAALHLHFAVPETNTPASSLFLIQLAANVVLVAGLYPLARGLAASAPARALMMGSFYFAVLGINGVIEAKYFTHLFDHGVAGAEVFYVLGAILIGGALGLQFGTKGSPTELARHNWTGWVGRGIAAWLIWPAVYLFFGMCVAPIVVPYYNAGVVGLQIPPMGTIFAVQLVRSLIFLAASVPFIVRWRGSRVSLWLALGLAHATVVGLYGLVAANFLPGVLRVAHAVEITSDGFAYAGLLVVLFGSPRTIARVAIQERAAAH